MQAAFVYGARKMHPGYSIAVHEAGHAVIGRVMGLVCGSATRFVQTIGPPNKHGRRETVIAK